MPDGGSTTYTTTAYIMVAQGYGWLTRFPVGKEVQK